MRPADQFPGCGGRASGPLRAVPATPADTQERAASLAAVFTSPQASAAFVRTLRDEFIQRGDQWENPTIDRFLDALAGWIEDSPGWYRNHHLELPAEGDWTFFARALGAATVYE